MTQPAFGLIVPHPPILIAGVGGDERQSAEATLAALEMAAKALDLFNPDTIVLMSPHAPAVYDTFLVDASPELSGSLADFGDRRVVVWRGDPELADAIVCAADSADIPVAPRQADARLRAGWLDHASIVPLEFLDPRQQRSLVVLSLSFLSLVSHRIFGASVWRAAEAVGRRVAFVASGDCSHRLTPASQAGYSARGREFDETLVRIIDTGRMSDLALIDTEFATEAGECGLRSFVALGGYMGEDPVATRILAYEGPWGVGYLTALVGDAVGLDESVASPEAEKRGSMESEIVSLARKTLQEHLRGGQLPPPILTSHDYPSRAGAFVSLHRGGHLRGCIGTIVPAQPTLGEEVAHNVLAAALNDPRFDAMTGDELDGLEIIVDVLYPAEPTTVDDLDPGRFGVIVTAGYRRGLLLPDLDGVDDVATQLDIALRKAGISPDEDFALERFRVDRFH